MVTQLAAALVSTGQAAGPYGQAPSPRAIWRSADDDARFLRYRLFLNFDSGKHDVGRLPIGQNPIMANYARVFVRKAASYLLPEPVTVNVTPPDDSAEAAAIAVALDGALTLVRKNNDLDAADLATAVDSAVLGDGAYKVTWDKLTRSVRIVPVDVQQLYVISDPDDVRRAHTVRQARKVHPEVAISTYGLARGDLDMRNDVEVVEAWTAQSYTVEVVGRPVFEVANPYGFIPYLIFPNTPRPHEFWGLSDIVDIIDVNRALDRRLSILAALLELSGNPVTVLENVTGSQGVSVAPGALWELPQDAKAYILELLGGGTIEQHLSFIEALYRVMDDLAEMPRLSWGSDGGVASGVALQVQLQPVIQKTQRKRMVWSGMIERRARYSLALMERFGGLDLGDYMLDDFGFEAVWAPVLPSDRQALVADEISLYQAGLRSQETALRSLGVEDTAAEADRIASDPAQTSSQPALDVQTEV